MPRRLQTSLAALTQGLPPAYWLLWLGTLVNRLGGLVVPFLALYLGVHRGIPASQAALVVSLFGAGSFISQMVGGGLADRWGRRPVMLLSFFSAPVAVVALGLAQDITLIAALTFAVGMCTDLYRPAVSAAIADLVPSEGRTRAYGYLYWAINLGAAVAPIAAGFLAGSSYLLLFVLDGASTLGFGLIVLFAFRETRPEQAAAHAAGGAGEAGRGGAGAAGGGSSGFRRTLSQLASAPILLVFSFLTLLFGIIYTQGNVTLPLDMAAHGLLPAHYGAAISINGLLIILITIPVSGIVSRWTRFPTIALAGLVLGIGFGFTALATTLPLFMLSVAIWTVGETVASAIAPTVVADLAPVELRGLYQGVFGAAWGLAYFVGPWLGGIVYQAQGPTALWAGCLALGVVLAAAYLALGLASKGGPAPKGAPTSRAGT